MERELTGNERFGKSILIFWRGLTDYFEEDELRFYHDLCRGKNCLAEVGNSQEDHSVYSAWVAFEMVRYYDRDIEALEEMRRYLAGKADEEPDWKDDLRNTVSGLYHEVYDTDGKYSVLYNTVDGIHHDAAEK